MTETTLQDVFTLQIRRQTNASNPSPFCEACKNGFVHVNSLQVRQFTQSGKLPGVCKACNEAFLRICRLQIRHLTRSDTHPHVCQICHKSFTHAGNIKKHMLAHERKNSGETNENGIDSPVKLPLHKPKPPYVCPHCEKNFVKYGSFVKHVNKHVMSIEASENKDIDLAMEEQQEVSVDINGENVTSPEENSIKKTDNINSQERDKPYKCDQCGKSFLKYGFFMRHSQTHETVSFDCKVCKEVFKTKPLLSSHMRIHKHVCKLCKEAFAVPEDLEVHLQNHMQNQNKVTNTQKTPSHFCSICQRGFLHIGYLKNHYRAHINEGAEPIDALKSDVKPQLKIRVFHHCDVCNRRFKFRRTLKKHMAVHNSGTLQQC